MISNDVKFHRIRSVVVQETYWLKVLFSEGTEKRYDLRQLERYPAFNLLFRYPAFIRAVKVDSGGYGVSWNDHIDIAAEELWDNGILEREA